MGKTYQHPPLIETLCEIQFAPDTPWDLVSPGLIYEQVREQFPLRRPGRTIALNVSPSDQGMGQEIQIVDRVQFLRDDKHALIQVGTTAGGQSSRPLPLLDSLSATDCNGARCTSPRYPANRYSSYWAALH